MSDAGPEAAMPKKRDPLDDLKRTLRFIGVAVFGILAGVIIIGSAGMWALTTKTNEIIATRNESRLTQCRRDNSIRHDAGEAAAKKAQDFIDSQKRYTHAGPSTGTLLQAEKDYVASQREVTLESYPLRDCTHIDEYYKNPPPPAPEEKACVPDGKGLCKTNTRVGDAATLP